VNKKIVGSVILGGLTAGLAGCGSPPPPPPPPTIVELTITAAPDANPSTDGQPSPIAVRIYQLAAVGAFEKSDYFELHDHEAAQLGQDLIARDEVVLTPGTSKTMKIETKTGTKFLGAVAGYRDIDQATWRADTDVPANQTTKVAVTAGKLTLTEKAGG
jgi:type VI secretion system protein VasD